MSIGICDLNNRKALKWVFALLCSALLSACGDSEGLSFAPKSEPAAQNAQGDVVVPKTTQTTLARGAVKLKAPKGYCIDETSVSNSLQGSSAMLAKCSSLDGKGAGVDTTVMSVQISARRGANAGVPTGQDLANAAMPRRTLQTKQKGALALVQIETGGNEVFSVADPVHWRAATALDTRLVLLGLFAPEGSEMTGDQGADLLATLAKGLSATRGTLFGRGGVETDGEAANVVNAQPKDVVENLTTDTVEPEKKGGGGFIARLLNRS